MPWEVTIRHPSGGPLGTKDAVRLLLKEVGFNVYQKPSGRRAVDAFEADGTVVPEFLREHLLKVAPQYGASFNGDGVSVEAYGFDEEQVTEFHLEFRGDGNPLLILDAICGPDGWVAVDDGSGQRVVSDGPWQAFRDDRRVAASAASDDDET